MPVKFGKDSKGCYAVWGSQKKYYYKCGSDSGKAAAAKKAGAQGAAIKRSGYKDGMFIGKETLKQMVANGEMSYEDIRPEDRWWSSYTVDHPDEN